MTAESPSTTDACAFSKREDGKHTWNFDGDDPYVICVFCDRMQDAINGRVIRPGRAPEFKETAGDLNNAQDVQESPAPSTTDRLAEAAPLSDEYLERIRSNAETWREMHDVMPEELMDIDVLLAEVDRARAHEQALLAHNGVLVTEVRFQAERADEQKGLAASLRARLDTAEGQLATARTQQMCTVIGAYVAWDIDNAERNDRPITHAIADKSEGKLRGAMATFQELLVALGEIEGDEDLEEVWEVVEAAMAADNPNGPKGVSR